MAQNQRAGERIAKVIARAGLASRREAEAWIAAGRVAVNGAKIASPALNVSPADKIVVDGKPLPGAERTRLFLYHKPRGLVTTTSDPQGRPTIFGALPKDLPRLISIGRLDLSTEGLLLLTNDGGLARALELPSTAWLRRYRVRAHGKVTQADLDALRDGVTVDGINYGPIEAVLDREQTSNVWITFGIREGKNREVRNVLRHLGLQVARLIRVSFGPFQLGELAEGEVAEVPTRVLRDQLGERLAKAAGVDFSGARDRAQSGAAELRPLPSRRERSESGGEGSRPAERQRRRVGGGRRATRESPRKAIPLVHRAAKDARLHSMSATSPPPGRLRRAPLPASGGGIGGKAGKCASSADDCADARSPARSRRRSGRPPTACAKSLFNILTHAYGDPVTGARVLDLFAGTGALGLEAISRGAKFALFVDDGAEARALIRQNVEALGLAAATRIFRRDATKLGAAHPVEPFSLVFLDPPYGKGLAEQALASALAGGWLDG